MTQILTGVGEVLTAVFGHVGSIADLIVNKPLFVLCLAPFILGGALKVTGFLKRGV